MVLDHHVQRKNVKLLLQTWIEKLKFESANMQKILDQQQPKKIELPSPIAVSTEVPQDPVAKALQKIESMTFEAITKFGWEQSEGQKIKIYLTSGLDGVGALPKGNVTCEFESTSFDLKIQDLHGKNYRLRVPELQNPIEIAECKHQVKSNSITITLKKLKDEFWTDLKPKATMLAKKDEETKKKSKDKMEDDSMGGLMDMMKEMYQNGNDDTRRMIQESWEKAHEEKIGRRPKSTGTVVQEKLREMRKEQADKEDADRKRREAQDKLRAVQEEDEDND